MSKRKAVRFAVRFTASVAIFSAAAVVLAGLSAFAMRSSRALPLDGAFDDEPQTSNRAIKSNRLSLLPATLAQNEPVGFVLASAPQGLDLERFYETVTLAQPMLPATAYEQPAPAPESAAATPEPKKPQAVAALPVTPEKSKRQAPPPAASNMFDDGAIAGLKTRLRLTEDQLEYWPAVESALREVARTQLRPSKKQMQTGKVNIDVNSPEVQRLVWAATPLIMRLRADQKNEVRKLARIMGLEQVASQI